LFIVSSAVFYSLARELFPEATLANARARRLSRMQPTIEAASSFEHNITVHIVQTKTFLTNSNGKIHIPNYRTACAGLFFIRIDADLDPLLLS